MQVAEFESEVDALHSELEKLEGCARVSLFDYVRSSLRQRQNLVVHDGF